MPAKTLAAPKRVLRIKITLRGSKPSIWRRLLVPSDMTFAQFHQTIQAAMGWYDCHLHEFRIGGVTIGRLDPELMGWGAEPPINERSVRLDQYLGAEKAKAQYVYDFGDDWVHDVVTEQVLTPEPGVSYPVCVAAKRRQPPEDCGGIWGYRELLEATANPDTVEKRERAEWAGPIDPDEFSIEHVNERLKPLRRKWARVSS